MSTHDRGETHTILTAAYNFRYPNNQAFRYKGRVIIDKLILNGKV